MEDLIREKALECGFDLVGFSEARLADKDKQNIQEWVDKKLYGTMHWYPKNQSLRLNFENLGFTPLSTIALGALYRTREGMELSKTLPFFLSEYAFGEDYHLVLRKKAEPLLTFLRKEFPRHRFRQGIDSLPISEKVIARNSGLGWIGKNTNLISPEKGSFFFLSIILTDLKIHSSLQVVDRCGSCRKCIEACPTGALFEEYKIDAGKCISHENIENREANLDTPLHGWVYGCDICQIVCPWNEKAIRRERFSESPEFKPLSFLLNHKDELPALSLPLWEKWTEQSALKRITHAQWLRNTKLI